MRLLRAALAGALTLLLAHSAVAQTARRGSGFNSSRFGFQFPIGGGATAQVQPGAISLYYASQATGNGSTTRRMLPNAAASTPSQSYMLTAARRLFANTNFYLTYAASGSTTVTDANAAAWDGTNDASTIVSPAAAWNVRIRGDTVSLPAGTYTLCEMVGAGSGTTGAQTFGITTGGVSTTNNQVTYSAGTPQQMFAQTFTLASAGNASMQLLTGAAGSSSVTLTLIDAYLFPGSYTASTCPSLNKQPNGDMTLGQYISDTTPAVSGGFVDLSSNGGLAQFPTTQTLGNFTIQAIVKKKTQPASSGGLNILFSSVQSYQQLRYDVEAETETGWSGFPNPFIGGSQISNTSAGITNNSQNGTQSSGRSASPGYLPLNNQAVMIGVVYDKTGSALGTAGMMYYTLNDSIVRAFSVGTGISANVSDIAMNYLTAWGNGSSTFYLGALGIWPSAFTPLQLENNYLGMVQAWGGTIPPSRFVLVNGHSIDAGYGANPQYSHYTASNLGVNASTPYTSGTYLINNAVSGSQLPDLVRRQSLTKLFVPPYPRTGTDYVTLSMIGVNDFNANSNGSATASTWLSSLASYTQTLKSYNFNHIGYETNLPYYSTGYTAWYNIVNPALVPGAANNPGNDFIVDYRGLTGINGTDTDELPSGGSSACAAVSANGNYADCLHPNNAGNGLMSPLIVNAVNAQ